ncbi:MAG: hypothetical protein WBA57_03560 [Elainellaceae cyanobacterium]
MDDQTVLWLTEPGVDLLIENSLFFIISLIFLGWTGWAWRLTQNELDSSWVQILLIGEIVVWGINYLLDLAQLPRLFRWPNAEDVNAEKVNAGNQWRAVANH